MSKEEEEKRSKVEESKGRKVKTEEQRAKRRELVTRFVRRSGNEDG